MNTEEITRLAKVEQKLKDFGHKLDDHITEQRNDFNTVFKKLDALNGKFAGKWVEKVTVGVLIGIITGLIIYIITIRGGL